MRVEIQAAVADMRDRHLGAGDEGADDGGAHTRVVVVALRLAEHPAIGEEDGRTQPVAGKRQHRIDPARPGDISGVLRPANEILNRIHRESRRHFAGGVPAHAIGDDEQPQLVVRETGIFVHVPDRTRLRYRASLESGAAAWQQHGNRGSV